MSRAEKLRVLALAKERIKRYAENAIDKYYPDEGPLRRGLYAKHMEFFAAGLTYRERCAICANRVGKCITFNTLVDTLQGVKTIGELYRSAVPFDVYAAPGVVVRASAPFKKPHKEPCLRFEMVDGRWFECALGHRILTTDGWFFAGDYVQLSRFQGRYAPDPLLSNLGYGPSILDADASRSTRKVQGFRENYFACSYQCDELLPHGSNNVEGVLPLRDDVPKRILAWLRGGGLDAKYTSIPRQAYAPLSTLDATPRYGGRFVAWLSRVVGTIVQWLFELPPIERLLFFGAFSPLPQGIGVSRRQIGGGGCCGLDYGRSNTPRRGLWLRPVSSLSRHDLNSGQKVKIELGRNPLKTSGGDGGDVKAVYFIGAHTVYDFSVETYHAYMAAGVVHHNSEGMGGYETALHLMGEYPAWWPGRRFTEPVNWWACGKTNETTRDIVQTKLMGPMGRIGTGLIRARCIETWTRKAGVHDLMDTVQIKHISGGLSVLGFKSYQQGRDSFEGTELDGIWDDEEPPEDIYGEQLIRTATTDGLMMLTFTPLGGRSRVVMSFMSEEDRLDI